MKSLYIILGLALLINACSNKQSAPDTMEPEAPENVVTLTPAQLKNAQIEMGTFSSKNIATVVNVNGKIDVPPQNMVSVSAPLGGYLKTTKLLPGMHVSKGEVIATMQDPQYVQLQQDYLVAKSKLHFAQLEYNRQKALNENQASSDKVTQQAQAEVSMQQIAMNALSEKLRLININPANVTATSISNSINIYSAINGYVSKVNVNIGKYVNPADVLFELIDPTDIHLNLKIYEKDIAQLAIGQKLKAYANNNPNVLYDCEIILISKDITNEGITEVHCHFEKYDKTLMPGMYMNAAIEVATNVNNALPEEAVVNFEGKNYVFVANSAQQFTLTAVTLGIKENGFVAISNAADFGQSKIVTKGAYTLLMKLKNKDEE